MEWISGLNRITLALIFIFVLTASGGGRSCSRIAKVNDTVKESTQKIVDVLDSGIESLNQNSSQWQGIVQDMQFRLDDLKFNLDDAGRKLVEQTRSTVRAELSSLVNRGVAALGTEVRCIIDFIGIRTKQAIIRLRASILNEAVPPLEPGVCQVDPSVIDMSIQPNSRNNVLIFGYDFDLANLRLTHVADITTDVTQFLTRTSHYEMAINLGANGIQLNAKSERLELFWNGNLISTIVAIQPHTPVCVVDEHVIQTPENVPVINAGGDDAVNNASSLSLSLNSKLNIIGSNADTLAFSSAGSASLTVPDPNNPNRLTKVWIMLSVIDTRIYSAPSGRRIHRILSEADRTAYISVGLTPGVPDINLVNRGEAGGLVGQYLINAQCQGLYCNATPYHLVKFILNPIRVELLESGNCVPPNQLKAAINKNLISEETKARLKIK